MLIHATELIGEIFKQYTARTEHTSNNTVKMEKSLDFHSIEDEKDYIQTQILFMVKDPRHDHEKPYNLRYDAGNSIELTNIKSEAQNVIIHNFRNREGTRNFEEYGFSIEKLGFPLTETIFDEQDTVEENLYPVIQNILKHKFPEAVGFHIMEHGVSYSAITFILLSRAHISFKFRKRHLQFPAPSEDTHISYTQPASQAHIGL